MMRRTPPKRTLAVAGVLLILMLLTAVLRAAPLSHAEAETLYIVRDERALSLDNGPRALLGDMQDALSTVADRAITANRDPIFHLLLGGWTFLAGDIVLSARWFSLLWALLAVAIAYRATRPMSARGLPVGWYMLALLLFILGSSAIEWAWWAFWGLLLYVTLLQFRKRPFTHHELRSPAGRWQALPVLAIVALLALYVIGSPLASLLNRPDWQQFSRLIADTRQPTEPLLITYDAAHPLAAYDHQPHTHFTTGLVITTGWREDRAPADVLTAISQSAVVWVLRDSPLLYAALSATHTATVIRADEHAGLELIRYDRRYDEEP